jgi:hypothetical protein
MLADAYELLRRDAVEMPGRSGGLQGLAVLIRKGMVSWMDACAGAASTPAVMSPPPRGSAMPLPRDLQREVVDVLVAMALTRETEVNA